MNVETAIRRAVPILAERGQTDIVMVWLIRAGLSREHAHDAMRFIPLAFGREILGGMGVALDDSYVRMSDGTQEERTLADEPFYREAQKLTTAFPPEVFTAVAMQSSEFQAVNQALNAGAQPDGLVASPPMIEWNRPADAPSSRPWWKFWA
jgi:hypothetical protein